MPARTGRASLVGLIGQPVAHSLSPAIHEYWIKAHHIDGAYIPFRHAPDAFPELMRALRALDLRGFNITVPYKSEILPHLDSIAPEAKAMGAVNTVVVEKGRWHGINTDGSGYLHHLRATVTPEILAHGLKSVLVLGGGGAARAIVGALLEAEAGEVILCNRSPEKVSALVQHLQPMNKKTLLRSLPWEERHPAVASAHLLINTTSLGMTGHGPLELSLVSMPEGGIISDIVYAPLETPLLREARERGLIAIEGLGMLLGQAAESFAAWFGVKPVLDDALRAHVLAVRGEG